MENHSLSKIDFDPKINFIFVRNLPNRNIRSMSYSVFTDEQQQAARFAKAMGHPVRMYVLELLNKQSCCYSGDLSDILPIAKSTLSQHLKELKDAGLIQGEIEAPKVKYCINKENWAKAQQLFKNFLDY
ncbi:DNA-binding transcriptional ArsR family regulator [Mangrovibacterium diazotrophicum]|uniref:DNA-binding transcriptional ArsR family regulator n=2 Tax=Mangrovibacterium diazotrophicum TaxID=1261403 RepID=A0A419W762_9BACT|nr:DNA-binding transcriptional ArsR family regulator [Mangrovibacterium diazotrophicum]